MTVSEEQNSFSKGMKSELVAEELRQRIADEGWCLGTRLPTEPELAESYAVGLNTVRRAVGILVDEGIVVRRQGSGTYVVRPEQGSAYDLGQWSQDGWSAPWQEGMSTRTWIDGYNFNHSGGKSLRVFYPKGKIGPADSGAQAPLQLTPGREYYLSYWVRFSSDFSWGTTEYAGKVGIGLAGGASCSGGQVCDGYNGFSSRMIWRSGGKAAIYYYHMGHEGQYGDYVDLKNASGTVINYPRGQWINLVQRLKVNTVSGGSANPDGEIDIWYNGTQAATIRGLRLVRNADLVDRAYFSSFFGGATTSFAPTNDSYIWYDDLKVSTQRSDVCEIASGGCHTRTFQAEYYSAMKGVVKKTTPDTGGRAGGRQRRRHRLDRLPERRDPQSRPVPRRVPGRLAEQRRHPLARPRRRGDPVGKRVRTQHRELRQLPHDLP